MRAAKPGTWIAVALSAKLRDRPMRILVDGRPLVLFRADGGLHCLSDLCPHRAAPLSSGKVVGGTIECPYHGWRFDADGVCRAMPGVIGPIPRAAVPRYAAIEREGLIFVTTGEPTGEPYVTALSGTPAVTSRVTSSVRSTLLDVAENILDATHTHFTHKGLLRGLSARRHRVQVTITGGDGWVEARYAGEPRQEGLVSRLLEGERSVSIGRFIAPGIAEIEFWGKTGINLATTFHLRQASADRVEGLGILSGPRQGGIGFLKALLFRPLFAIAVAQDHRILHAASDNAALNPGRQPMLGPLDLMRPHIAAILAGKRPSVADAPITLTMEL